MRIAVDFDGTLCIDKNPNLILINKLKMEQSKGAFIMLFTSRTGKSLNEAVIWSAKYGLRFNQVIGGKPIADIYIDDKGIKP